MNLTRHSPEVEQHRALLVKYANLLNPGLNIDYALQIMWGESQGDPDAVNTTNPDPEYQASGLFQHIPAYFKWRCYQAALALQAAGHRPRWVRRAVKGIIPSVFHIKAHLATMVHYQSFYGWQPWSASERFPEEAYGDDVWWQGWGYVRVSQPGRFYAP